MDKSFFFNVWFIYNNHWGRQEQEMLKKKYYVRELHNKIEKIRQMSTPWYHYQQLLLISDRFSIRDMFIVIKSLSQIFAGEYTKYDVPDDPLHRIQNNIHIYHKYCRLSVKERQWKSLKRYGDSKYIYFHNTDSIYNVSAMVVLPPLYERK